MAGLNKVTLIGNLGADPELRYTKSGTPVANMRMATTRVYTDSKGDRHEQTTWHRIVAWGKTAELCKQYLSKGRQVFVEGRLQDNQYQDAEGVTHRSYEIVAEQVLFLGSRPAESNSSEETSDEVSQEERELAAAAGEEIPFD